MPETMEMSPLERAARALRDEARRFSAPVALYVESEFEHRWEAANPGGDFWTDGPGADRSGEELAQESWAILVRAVLQAIRAPTPEMIEAAEGADCLSWSPEEGEGLDGVSWGKAWQAMIDALLTKAS
jgi:hypothetical protein